MSFFGFLCVVVGIAVVAYKINKWWEMEKLRETNPKQWMRIKRMEHAERLMEKQLEQQKKQLRHDQLKTGMNIGMAIFRMFGK